MPAAEMVRETVGGEEVYASLIQSFRSQGASWDDVKQWHLYYAALVQHRNPEAARQAALLIKLDALREGLLAEIEAEMEEQLHP